jgi:ATP synthase I chain
VDIDRAIARIPKWIVAIGILGTGLAGILGGLPYLGSFCAGAAAALLNFWLIERFVNRLGAAAMSGTRPSRTGFRMFIRFLFIALGAFVILKFTGINPVVALCGFLVCPAAVILEIIYELIIYGHS